LDLDIEAIHVTVTGGGEDEETIAKEVQQHLGNALAELSRSEGTVAYAGETFLRLDLEELDWNMEPDKTGAILRLLMKTLERAS
jgi:hypothetical protein